jgi:hypothetical protein
MAMQIGRIWIWYLIASGEEDLTMKAVGSISISDMAISASEKKDAKKHSKI